MYSCMPGPRVSPRRAKQRRTAFAESRHDRLDPHVPTRDSSHHSESNQSESTGTVLNHVPASDAGQPETQRLDENPTRDPDTACPRLLAWESLATAGECTSSAPQHVGMRAKPSGLDRGVHVAVVNGHLAIRKFKSHVKREHEAFGQMRSWLCLHGHDWNHRFQD